MARFSEQAVTDLRIVERQRLHDALHRSLRPGTVQFSAPVGEPVNGETGEFGDAGLVVAADGIRSTLRAAWPDNPSVRYAGYLAYRAVTAEPVRLDFSGETWGAGRRFGIAPLSDGRVYWFATVNRPRGHRLSIDLADLERMFGDWHQPVPAVLRATAVEAVTLLPIEELAHCPASFWLGNMVLVGDAAHAMTPNLGQGANQALEDAATLAALVAPYADQARPSRDRVRHILAAYHQRRSARVRAISRRARWIGALGQWEHPAAVRLRDAVLSRLPDAPLNAATVRMQAWTPALEDQG